MRESRQNLRGQDGLLGFFAKEGRIFFAKKFEVFYNGANDDTITEYHHGGLRPLFHGGKSK